MRFPNSTGESHPNLFDKNRLIDKNKMVKKRLYRNKKDRMIAGVCSGIADYLNADPTIVRLIWAIATIFTGGLGIFAYIVAWIIVPERRK